jgi:hypothetical protein
VDDFGVQYINQANADHLASTLTSLYTITTDWTGSTYLSLTPDWDYEARTCDVSMPGYISCALQRFTIPTPTKVQHSPHAWKKPNYGAKTQLTEPADVSTPLPPKDRKHLQEVIGVLLYYGRAVDSTILVALGTHAAAQAQGTQATAEACTHLLKYCATHPDAVIRYTASDMVLHVHSEASYLSEPKARSRVGGLHYLSSPPRNLQQPPSPNDPPPPLNGAILVISNIMKQVLASASKAETVDYSTTAKWQQPSEPPYSKWAAHNHPLRSKRTT